VTPVTWCGGTPSATDRPDVAGGDEIHVIYASPSDSPDRFVQVASAIATDVGAIDAWWRKQDPTRAPRWDIAAFPSCTGFGALDISDVKLPHDTAYYNQTTTPRLQLIRDDLVADGFDDPTKKYLVYYDQAQPSVDTDCGSSYISAQGGGAAGYAGVFIAPNLESSVPGRGCGSIETTGIRGGYLAVVAVHELVHDLGALDTTSNPGPPHKCPGDPVDVCDSTLDVLAPNPSATSLATAVLDYGHDDYYDQTGTWWDVRDSAWLRHLNEPEYDVDVDVGKGGTSIVDSTQTGMFCTSLCAWSWAKGGSLTLQATPAAGYRFVGWDGCPSPSGATCTLTVRKSLAVTASFAPPLRLVGVHLAFGHGRQQLTATAHLNEAGEATAAVCSFGGQAATSSTVNGSVATCTWTVQPRFRGHRIRGDVELQLKGTTVLTKTFHVVVPAAG
jgi:hypothetical protein